MIVFPNAKINLGLHVTAKRPDGFHEIESVLYPVVWQDVLEMLPAEELAFRSSGIPIPGEAATNLCLKAYHALAKDFALPPVHIHLHKVIPIGAGLGGGSADGAFAIKLLNTLFDLQLPVEQLSAYARTLGSDCAFFIRNQPVLGYGKGDQFREVEVNLSGYFLALINPQLHVGTAEAYAGITPAQPDTPLQSLITQPIGDWKDVLQNDFEPSVFAKYPEIAAIKTELYQMGALYASMSGSGSTVYGIFAEEVHVTNAFPTHYQVWQGKLS